MIEIATLVSTLIETLSKYDWKVRPQSDSQTDLVVTAPDGKTFVIELKGGTGPAHFASLARVAGFADRLAQDSSAAVTPVLLTTQNVSPGFEQVAEEVGVELFGVSDDTESTEQVAESVVQQLQPPR